MPAASAYEKDIKKYVMMPGIARKGRHVVVEAREKKLDEETDAPRLQSRGDARIRKVGVVCCGVPPISM